MVGDNQPYPVGQNVAVVVKSKDLIGQFSDFTEGASQPAPTETPSTPAPQPQATQQQQSQPRGSGERVIASPLAKSIANSKGIDLSGITGSGPHGRILKQDVEGHVPQVAVKA
jgi:pyruvate dehydrogenase E2 component (dihydrolipoamide acetyltransferase)